MGKKFGHAVRTHFHGNRPAGASRGASSTPSLASGVLAARVDGGGIDDMRFPIGMGWAPSMRHIILALSAWSETAARIYRAISCAIALATSSQFSRCGWDRQDEAAGKEGGFFPPMQGDAADSTRARACWMPTSRGRNQLEAAPGFDLAAGG